MTRKQAVEQFNKETKQERTIKVKTLLIGLLWFATIIASGIAGWTFRSDFSNEVRSEVKSQMVVFESKNNQ